MKKLIDDDLWAIVEPMRPPHRPPPKGGRPFVDDRAALTGIVFVRKTGIPWMAQSAEMGCGGGVTCWRRLRNWRRAGVWDRLHVELRRRFAEAERIDWSRASVDARSVPAKRGAKSLARTRRTAPGPASSTI